MFLVYDDDFQIYVFFPNELKIGVKVIKAYMFLMRDENIHRAIIVVRHGMTPSAKACQAEIAGMYQMDVFQVIIMIN